MRCRVCGAQTKLFQQVEGVRKEERILSIQPFTVDTVKIDIYECIVCGHIQTENLLPPNFYDTNDSRMQGQGQHIHTLDTYEEKAKKLRRHTAGDAFLEIGSGAGAFLRIAGKYFTHCTGVEPSLTYEYAGNFDGNDRIRIVHGYFDRGLFLEGDYDTFASFQVFEHLEAPLEALQLLHSVCRENAYGIINVPNGQQIFARALYHQVILQHVNYYTPMSLCILARCAGFTVEEIEADEVALELNLYCRKAAYSPSMNQARARDRARLLSALDGKRVAIWGAGAKSATYAELLGRTLHVAHVVDDDPKKAGLYIANSNLPVERPSVEIFSDVDAVLVFATSYWDEILDALQHQFGFTKEIVGFDA